METAGETPTAASLVIAEDAARLEQDISLDARRDGSCVAAVSARRSALPREGPAARRLRTPAGRGSAGFSPRSRATRRQGRPRNRSGGSWGLASGLTKSASGGPRVVDEQRSPTASLQSIASSRPDQIVEVIACTRRPIRSGKRLPQTLVSNAPDPARRGHSDSRAERTHSFHSRVIACSLSSPDLGAAGRSVAAREMASFEVPPRAIA